MTAFSRTAARFWSKVDTSGDCWVWRGGLSASGYGAFGVMGKTMGAHRMAWILAHGEIPAGMCVCHSCDNKKCVRPVDLGLYRSLQRRCIVSHAELGRET